MLRSNTLVLACSIGATLAGAGCSQHPVASDVANLGAGTSTIRNVHSQLVLDDSEASTADGAHILQWLPSGNDNQSWKAQANADGSHTFVNVHSNKCLDVAGESTASGAPLQQWACWGGDNQKFTLTPSKTSAGGCGRARA